MNDAQIIQDETTTALTVSTWIELNHPPTGARVQVEITISYDGMEIFTEEVLSKSGWMERVPRALKLQNPRVLRAVIGDVENLDLFPTEDHSNG